uniref:Tudor domain-containing protein n=1 Tax=Ananas comosus var. bracteatus TaxID=296719 RepID=A0A6V7QIR6_ANACO|nr:unnamed protein product [Ananas comosus var. bracteatus]
MEVSIEKPSASNITRKSRSLDLKSIYVKQSRVSARKSWSQKGAVGVSQESKLLKRKRNSGLENRLSFRRKRTRKDASLSAFEFGFRRLRSSSNVSTLKPCAPVSSAEKKENSNGLTRSAFNSSNLDCHASNLGSDPLPLSEKKNLTGSCDNTAIPKQPRDLLLQKKSEKSKRRKRLAADLHGKSSNEAQAQYNEASNKNKRKKKSNEFQVNSVSGDDQFNNRNGSSSHVANRKVISRKNLPLPNNAGTSNGDLQEDEEENVEQDAVRMLCSLVDPKGAECKEDKVTSPSKPVNGRKESKGLHAEVAKVDSVGRVLRPRKFYGKSFVRKRRHFYEVCLRDLDPFCIVKHRIRVFWPLDESWYFGLVKEYDPASRMHFVRYDDHDEEWVDLQKERFKLLAFPSEIGSKLNVDTSRLKGKQKYRAEEVMDDDSAGSSTESEPIISWLAQRSKSSSVSNVKKQNHLSLVRVLNQSNIEPNNLFSSCHVPQSPDSFGDRKFPVVYFRRRFRNRKEGSLNVPEEHSFRKSICPVGFFASALEELTEITTLMERRQITLMLSSPLQSINKVVYKADNFWLCRAMFLLQRGKLMSGFPLVCLELIFVDNDLGLRYLSLELSLRMAVSLVFVLMRAFHKHDEQHSFKELEMPFTSIRFKISGMDDRVGQVSFVLFSFFSMKGLNWRYVEEKLMHNSMEMKELAKADCTYINIKNLRNERNRKIFTFADAILAECLSKGYSKDLAHHFLREKLLHTNANPAIYFLNEKYVRPPLCHSPVPDTPSFLLGLHLTSLIEECPNKNDKLSSDMSSSVEDPLDQVSSITLEAANYSSVATSVNSKTILFSETKSPRDAFSTSNDEHWRKSSTKPLGKEINVIDNSVSNISLSSPDKSECGDDLPMSNLKLQDQMLDRQDENSFSKSNLVSEMNGFTIPNAKLTAPRSIWHRSRRTSISRTFGDRSKLWARDFMRDFSVCNSKKPRTEVSYSFSKSQTNRHKSRPYKIVRTNNSKGFSGYSGSPKSHLDSSVCEANVLVITKEKGWRECGAQVILDLNDRDWKMVVKISGVVKYIYKAEQFLQPGTTNRFTRAMMWRGEKIGP